MTTSRQQYIDGSHPSLAASMDDYDMRDMREFSPTIPDMPSQHSGFRSNHYSEYSEGSSRRSYSPPAWRKAGSGWFNKHNASLSPTRQGGYRSRETSPRYPQEDDNDGDVTAYQTARHIPLPESPIKGRTPSNSPEPLTAATGNEGGDRTNTVRHASEETQRPEQDEEPEYSGPETPTQKNCECTNYMNSALLR